MKKPKINSKIYLKLHKLSIIRVKYQILVNENEFVTFTKSNEESLVEINLNHSSFIPK